MASVAAKYVVEVRELRDIKGASVASYPLILLPSSSSP